MTGSTMTGIKYVPVKVKTSDFAEFAKAYEVTQNGDELTGGYTERKLFGYSGIYAAVDSSTNGLKAVTKSGNSFSFGARQTGKDSGIKGTELKTVDKDNIKVEPQKFSGGTYGSMFRVHLTGSAYGDLGSRMQSVTWQYYGDSETVLQTYGTKFAADIWMHGNNGIQLGLTKSLRAELPEGTDGTGKWVGTIHALGYKDFTFTVNLAAENVRDTGKDPMTNDQRTELTKLKDEAGALLKNYDASKATDAEKTLKEHYDEAVALLENENATTSKAAELLRELPDMIAAVKNAKPTTTTKSGEATVTETDGKYVAGSYQAKITVTFDADGKVLSIADNSTKPGDQNAPYWNIAKGKFADFEKKSVSEIDGIDAKSSATVSLNAVKSIIKELSK